MGILLAFTPLIAFILIDELVGPTEGLVAGAVASLALPIRDFARAIRTPRAFEIGTMLLFGGLALYATIEQPRWPENVARLFVYAGLLVIVLSSMAVGRPFTLQYVGDRVSGNVRGSSQFIRVNYLLTAAWALAFTVMVVVEILADPTLLNSRRRALDRVIYDGEIEVVTLAEVENLSDEELSDLFRPRHAYPSLRGQSAGAGGRNPRRARAGGADA
jgi:hypothetical protein